LLALGAEQPSEQQKPLRDRVLSLAGFEDGDDVKVWSEIALSDQETKTDYRLDYVLRRADDPPVIVEIMTASTSGGNRAKGTDMKSAYGGMHLTQVATIYSGRPRRDGQLVD